MRQEFLLTAIALLAGAALILLFLPWKTQRVDPRIMHEFNKVFMTTSKEGKEALIERWMARKKCGRLEAMRLALEEWRRENR